MPKASTYTLLWLPEQRQYAFYVVNQDMPLLQGDSEAWFVWLANNKAFSFRGQYETLFLQKEERPRGKEGYWYAYRRQGKRMLKKYVGQSVTLSMARLEAVARAIVDQVTPVLPDEFLLLPKLRPPQMHTRLVARTHLFALLDAGRAYKLMLLSAPAGFGKTTLVSSWIAARGADLPPVAWLALDSADNDPLRFWHYLVAACQPFLLGDKNLSLAPLSPGQPFAFQRYSLEGMCNALLNGLSVFPGSGILVLEDYHAITEPEIHRVMGFFLEHLPAQLHVILLLRAEPPLPLARLRVHGDLVELGISHLRFSEEEARTLLDQTLPFALDEEAFQVLFARSEGWITGLWLITLALKIYERPSEQRVEQLLATISGKQRFIIDYLVSDVLNSQPATVQTFLLQTSGLSRLNAALCDAVMGRNDSAMLLEQIERANLFLCSVDYVRDHVGRWYRYHTLFAEAMQHEARLRLGQALLDNITMRASRWYEQQGLLEEAVEYALLIKDFARVAALIDHIIDRRGLHQFSEFHTLLRWLTPLPEALLQVYPVLCQAYARALLFSTDRYTPMLKARLERYLHMAEDSLRAAGDTSRLAQLYALRTLVAGHMNDLTVAIHCAYQALALLPVGEHVWRSIALSGIGVDHLLAGRLRDAAQCVQEAQRLMATAGYRGGARATLHVLGDIYTGQGKAQQATELYQRVLREAGEDRLDQGFALAGLATLAYERNDLVAAAQMGREASLLAQDLANEMLLLAATVIVARVLYAQGEIVAAQNLLLELPEHLTQERWLLEIEAWQAWFALASGDPITAQDRLHALQALLSQQENAEAYEIYQERAALFTVRLLLAQGSEVINRTRTFLYEGKNHELTDILKYWRTRARDQIRMRSEVEILLLMAQVYFQRRCVQEAQNLFKEALFLARPAGYHRIFLDEGAQMAKLFRQCSSGIHERSLQPFLHDLREAFAAENHPASSFSSGVHLEPLSPQELRVLRLLVAGLSNPEIAAQLVVSRNTIKTQVRSIYHKLGVNNRLAASNIARQRHLL